MLRFEAPPAALVVAAALPPGLAVAAADDFVAAPVAFAGATAYLAVLAGLVFAAYAAWEDYLPPARAAAVDAPRERVLLAAPVVLAVAAFVVRALPPAFVVVLSPSSGMDIASSTVPPLAAAAIAMVSSLVSSAAASCLRPRDLERGGEALPPLALEFWRFFVLGIEFVSLMSLLTISQMISLNNFDNLIHQENARKARKNYLIANFNSTGPLILSSQQL